jgi:hypothetical protein
MTLEQEISEHENKCHQCRGSLPVNSKSQFCDRCRPSKDKNLNKILDDEFERAQKALLLMARKREPLDDLIIAGAGPQTPLPPVEKCEWKTAWGNNSFWVGCNTRCAQKEHAWTYCPYCGKPIEEKK